MAVTITTPGVSSALRQIAKQVDGNVRVARSWIGHHSVAALRSPSSSLVNVDTGKMRRSFVYSLQQGRIEIGNTARSPQGYPYPVIIERRFRGVQRTLIRNRRRIARQAQKAVDAGFRENRGAYRRSSLSRR